MTNEELRAKILNEFERLFSADKEIHSLYELIKKGTATEKDAYKFATRCSDLTNQVFEKIVKPEVGDNPIYYELAEQTIIPMLEKDYGVISSYCVDISQITLEKLELGLKPIQPKLDYNRAEGIAKVVSEEETYNPETIGQKISNFNDHIVDEHIKENARFMGNSGINTKITRILGGHACDWCKDKAGVYIYPDVPHEVFMRHDNCKCQIKVEYKKRYKRPSYYMDTSGHAFVRSD